MSTTKTETATVVVPAAEDTQQSYKGFGSFHSDNVEDLVALPDDKYTPPQDLPDFAKSFPPLENKPANFPDQAFGRWFRENLFTIDDSWCFINHGAFGGALREGIIVKRRYEDLMESQMLAFIDRMLLPLLVYSTRCLAKFLNARPTDVVLVTNATFGLNAAISTVMHSSDDVVAYLDTEYGSVWKMMRERWSVVRCNMNEIPLGKYLNDESVMKSDEDVTKYIESQLPKGCTVFVVDHIASTSAIMLPIFSHIVPMLKRNGVEKIVVDGAHGPLQTKLDFLALPEENLPTFYVGNLHKWVSCPKSVGFIWAHPSIQAKTHTTVVSHGSRSGYASEFIWDGTKDYGAYLSVPAVLDFWQNTVSADKAREYCTKLLLDAEKMLCQAFHTEPVQRHAPMMGLVRLPKYFRRPRFSAKFIQDTLHAAYQVEIPIKDVEGILYARVSAFVYNDIHDYEKFRDAVLDLRVKMMKRARSEDPNNANNSNGGSTTSGAKEEVVIPTEPHDSDEDCTKAECEEWRKQKEAAEANPNGDKKSNCDNKCAGCGVSGLGGGKSNAFSFSSDEDDE